MKAMRTLAAIVVATAIWIPSLQLFFKPAEPKVLGEALAQRQRALHASKNRQDELNQMRATNPEWDFMGRTFGVLALANMALEGPNRAGDLSIIDAQINETLALERAHGSDHFLLPYSKRGPFKDPSQRSLFVEGEIALMIAARLMVSPDTGLSLELQRRITRIEAQLLNGPILSAESYPNECWTFCNTVALAALRLADAALAQDHSALTKRWVEVAKSKLLEPSTKLLVSSYTWDGQHLDGPEGSSIWLSAHMLQMVDPDFAKDQYTRARKALGATLLGFSWAREWPNSAAQHPDVDSGPIIPIVEASAGSSGLALIGAHAFKDRAFLDGLLTSLQFAAFPMEEQGRLRYAASNQVGDAVMLYALVEGPLFEAAHARLSKVKDLL